MVLAMLFLAAMDVCAKFLANDHDVLQIVWIRFFGQSVVVMILLFPIHGLKLIKSNHLPLQLIRSVLMILGTFMNFISLRYLQLDQTAAIAFTSPFWVVLFSAPLLGERVSRVQVLAIAAGFIGVLVITRPGFGEVHWAAYLSVGVALVLALFQIATRKLASIDNDATTLFYTTALGAVVVSPFVMSVWTTPNTIGWFAMLLLGVLGLAGHYCIIVAHRYAPAGVLAPFVYTQIIWMIVFGFIIFADVPDFWTLVGATIVVSSGLYLWHRARSRQEPAHSQ